MGKRRHPEDHTLYLKLLESTRDSEGVVYRRDAVKLLRESLAEDTGRVDEYAEARANEVANGFDESHKPETENGQMVLDFGTYLVIGDSERVRVDDAMQQHTRRWLDLQNETHARESAAWAAKTMRGYKLLEVQEKHKCSMWKAEQILRGD